MIADDIIKRVCMAEAGNERVELHRALDGRVQQWLVLELIKRPLSGRAPDRLTWCEKRHQNFATEQIARAAYEVSVRRIAGVSSGSQSSLSALVEQRAELLADEAEGPALAAIAKRVRELEAREHELEEQLHEAHARIAELEADIHRALHDPTILKLDPDSVARLRRPDQDPK